MLGEGKGAMYKMRWIQVKHLKITIYYTDFRMCELAVLLTN